MTMRTLPLHRRLNFLFFVKCEYTSRRRIEFSIDWCIPIIYEKDFRFSTVNLLFIIQLIINYIFDRQ